MYAGTWRSNCAYPSRKFVLGTQWTKAHRADGSTEEEIEAAISLLPRDEQWQARANQRMDEAAKLGVKAHPDVDVGT